MPKKILFFCGGSYIAGMEIVTLHLMRGLKENGYEVKCIFSGWHDGKFKAKLEEMEVEGHAIKVGWLYIRKPLWTLDTLINYPKAYYASKKILKDFNPDICQFCNFSMSIMLYRLIKPASVYSLHETYAPNKKTNTIFRLLNKKIKYFTAVSGHIANVLAALQVPKEKIRLIYNGIPIPAVQTPAEATGFNTRTLNFAIVGQLVKWKGLEVLVNAVEKLVQRGIKNYRVLIFGNDDTTFGSEIKTYIESLGLSEYFIWKGFVADQAAIYRYCDVVIVPSLSAEPCSMTVIESMAWGKALIVSDRGGNPELVPDKITGLVFRSGDAEHLSTCMDFLLTNRPEIADLGKAGRDRAAREYSYITMTNNYIKLYDKL